MACYKVRPGLGQPLHVPQLGLYVHDQFGPLRNDTKREGLYCASSGRRGKRHGLVTARELGS